MFILFHCLGCHLRDKVEIPKRAHAVDLEFWLTRIVMPRVAELHSTKMPFCRSAECDLALPIDDPDDPKTEIGQLHDQTKHKPDLGIFDRDDFHDSMEPLGDEFEIKTVRVASDADDNDPPEPSK